MIKKHSLTVFFIRLTVVYKKMFSCLFLVHFVFLYYKMTTKRPKNIEHSSNVQYSSLPWQHIALDNDLLGMHKLPLPHNSIVYL